MLTYLSEIVPTDLLDAMVDAGYVRHRPHPKMLRTLRPSGADTMLGITEDVA